MKNSYEQFNEITFESYCKKAIDRAVLKGRIKKSARAEREISLSTLTDEALPVELPKLAEEQESVTFQVRGLHIPVNDTRLGQALLFLPPKKREVILLAYFLDMSDAQIGALLGKSRSDIQYQRTAAQTRLKRLVESGGGHE